MIDKETLKIFFLKYISYIFPNYILKKMTLRGSLIVSKILCIKVLEEIANKNNFDEYISNIKYKIIFKSNKNQFSVFNMCYLSDMLGKSLLALSLNAVPVFDVKDRDGENYYTTFFKINNSDEINQLKEIKLSKTVECYTVNPRWFMRKKEQKAWHHLYKKYFTLRKDIMDKFEKEFKNKKNHGIKDIIGCVVRGTDYEIKKPKGHPIQPTIEEIINELKKIKEDNDNTVFYVVSDEQRYFERINKCFPGGYLQVNVNIMMLYMKQEIKTLPNSHSTETMINTCVD